MAASLMPVIMALLAPKFLEGVDKFVSPGKGGGLKKTVAAATKRKKGKKNPPAQGPKKKKGGRKKKGKGGRSTTAAGQSSTTSGTEVQAGSLAAHRSIPANYGSEGVDMGTKVLGKTSDGLIVRMVDLMATIDTTYCNATASGVLSNGMKLTSTGAYSAPVQVNPELAGLLPNYYIQAETWERWRPLAIALHYRQMCPSTTAGAVYLALLTSDNVAEKDATINALATSGGGTATASVISALKGTRQGALNQDLSTHWQPEVWNPKEGGAPWYECGGSFTSNIDTVPGYINVAVDLCNSSIYSGKVFVEFIVEFAGPRAPYLGAAGLSRLAARARISSLTDEQKAHVRAQFVASVRRLYKDIVEPLDRIKEVDSETPGMSRDEVQSALIDMVKKGGLVQTGRR